MCFRACLWRHLSDLIEEWQQGYLFLKAVLQLCCSAIRGVKSKAEILGITDEAGLSSINF